MPNPKTALRFAMAAVAVPGVIVGVAAPAASAAELSPATDTAKSHVSEAQHTSMADMKNEATSTASKYSVSKESVTKTTHSDLTSQHVLQSSSINGKSVSV